MSTEAKAVESEISHAQEPDKDVTKKESKGSKKKAVTDVETAPVAKPTSSSARKSDKAKAEHKEKHKPRRRFESRESIPYLEVELNINTEAARHLVKRVMEWVPDEFYYVSDVLYNRNMIQAGKIMEELIDLRFKDTEKIMNEDIGVIEAMMESLAINKLPKFSHPRTIPLKMTCPLMGRYLTLVRRMEHYIACIEAVRLSAGSMNSLHRVTRVKEWQQRLIRLANFVKNQATRIRSVLYRRKTPDMKHSDLENAILAGIEELIKSDKKPEKKPAAKRKATPVKKETTDESEPQAVKEG